MHQLNVPMFDISQKEKDYFLNRSWKSDRHYKLTYIWNNILRKKASCYQKQVVILKFITIDPRTKVTFQGITSITNCHSYINACTKQTFLDTTLHVNIRININCYLSGHYSFCSFVKWAILYQRNFEKNVLFLGHSWNYFWSVFKTIEG